MQRVNGEHDMMNRIAGVANKTGVATSMEVITPELASTYMLKNAATNRRMMLSVVMRYAAEMISGAWLVTHEGIAFDWEGNLIDGQHRLQAIIKAGIPVTMLVFRGLDPKCMAVVNRGRMRSLAHALQCIGFTESNNDTVAVARAMIIGPVGSQTNIEASQRDSCVMDFIVHHVGAIALARTACPKPHATAILRAVVARASYHADESVLSRFGLAISDRIPAGEMEDRDVAARRFGDQCKRQMTGGGAGFRIALYRRWQNVLHKYVDGVAMTKVYECDKDLFPLPSSDAW